MIFLQPAWPGSNMPSPGGIEFEVPGAGKVLCDLQAQWWGTSHDTGCPVGQSVLMEEGKQRRGKAWEGGTVIREGP